MEIVFKRPICKISELCVGSYFLYRGDVYRLINCSGNTKQHEKVNTGECTLICSSEMVEIIRFKLVEI